MTSGAGSASTRKTYAVLAAILVLAFGFRLWMLQSYQPGAPWVAALTLTDAEMGRNLLAGRGWVANSEMIERATQAQHGRPAMVDLQELLPVDDAKPGVLVNPGSSHSPGYSAWFAISYWLGGDVRYVHSQRMQALLDALACLLIFGIGRRVWSVAAGVAAAGWYAVSPAHAFLGNLTVAAATDSFWFVAVAYAAVRAWDTLKAGRRPWREAVMIAAAALGGAVMNSTSFALPAVVAGAALVATVFDRRQIRLVPYFVAAQLIVMLVLVPWGLRSERLFGQFSLVRGSFWQLAYASWGELPNPWGLGFDDKYYWNWIEENCPGCNAGQQAAAIGSYIQSSVIPSPGFARHISNLVDLRLPRLISVAQMRPGFDGSPAAGVLRPQLGAWVRITDALVPVVAVLVFTGLIVIAVQRANVPAALIALGPSVFLIGFSLVFYVELRKTVPAYGALFVFAGIAIVEMGQRLARLRGRAALAVLLVAAAVAPPVATAAVVSAGQMHSVAVKPDGTVWTWGAASRGQLGDGFHGATTSDGARAELLAKAVAVAAGGNHTLVLQADGTVWAWGDNLWGELGDGTRTTRAMPALVPGLGHIVAIAAGYLHSLALSADGTVWAWGNNHFGQLGNGTMRESLRPVRVQVEPASGVAAGFFHSLAIDRSGQAWSWGQNTRGQLGHGGPVSQPRPGLVGGISDVASISGGQFHTLATLRDGSAWSWGANIFGQLGRAWAAVTDPVPQRIDGLPAITQVAAGEDHSAALSADGRVWTWGDNLYGQLGDGTWTVRRSPVLALAEGPVTAVASGHAHVVATIADGRVLTWGFGHDGQLGDNLTTRRLATPRAVAAVTLTPGPDFSAPSFHPVGSADATLSSIARYDQGVFTVQGEADSATGYVISALARRAGPAEDLRLLAAAGTLTEGCVTVGVQEDARWVFYKNFSRPGPFTIEWQPPANGSYTIVIAHCLPPGRTSTHFEIARLGWFDARAQGLRPPS